MLSDQNNKDGIGPSVKNYKRQVRGLLDVGAKFFMELQLDCLCESAHYNLEKYNRDDKIINLQQKFITKASSINDQKTKQTYDT